MDLGALIFAIAIFIAVSSFVVFIISVLGQPRSAINRLKEVSKEVHIPTLEEMELAKPFLERIVGPASRKGLDFVVKYTPQHVKDRIRKRLAMAGNPHNLHSEEFLAIKLITFVSLPLGVLLFCHIVGFKSQLTMLFTMVFFVLGFLLPDSYINQAIKLRQKQIQNTLPYFLDLMVVGMEAGLGFDAAVNRVIQKSRGPLSDEFNRALQEIRIGKHRREAMRDIANRAGVDDLSTFLAAIIQADELGISIGNVLRVQAQQFRVKRRQRAEEAAMKLPVKMLFPLVFCIFPAIFIVLLGPAVLIVKDIMPSLSW
ncbi:MAG: type II secretion system F family protein [bacterium]|jgi:tight adherence protein C|nr:type II secretion system F family protein [bacterium]MDD3804697.1 type II secretion system F family protein [bacterium]